MFDVLIWLLAAAGFFLLVLYSLGFIVVGISGIYGTVKRRNKRAKRRDMYIASAMLIGLGVVMFYVVAIHVGWGEWMNYE